METIPRLGFGTYQIAPRDTGQLVGEALRAGYRHIDTARYYRNEAGVGAAVRASGLDRDDIWITSKLPIGADDAGEVRGAIDATVDALGTHVDLYRYCAERGIAVAAWSPLGAGSVLHDPAIRSVAAELGRTPAQVILRWHLQRGDIVLPKASSPQRIAENAAVFDFSLDARHLARIDRLDRGEAGRTGPHPERL
ncbi:aldo/keto reductase [Actinoplanes sp. NPDC000266]